MRYNATIKYKGNSITIKVPNKAFEKTFELTDFLKMVRELHGIDYKAVHRVTDFESTDCEAFEKGTKPITQLYLKCFAKAFMLPAKLKYLGIIEEEETRKILAARLKELRIRENLSQEIIALDLNIARSTYSCYETGKNEPDICTLVKLADYYKVSLDYLAGRF